MSMIRAGILVVAVGAVIATSSCAYRMPPVMMPAQHRLKLLVSSPERFSVHVQGKDYPVSPDGAIVFESSAMRGPCRVYLFNRIPLGRDTNPLRATLISIFGSGKTVRTLSFAQGSDLPLTSSE